MFIQYTLKLLIGVIRLVVVIINLDLGPAKKIKKNLHILILLLCFDSTLKLTCSLIHRSINFFISSVLLSVLKNAPNVLPRPCLCMRTGAIYPFSTPGTLPFCAWLTKRKAASLGTRLRCTLLNTCLKCPKPGRYWFLKFQLHSRLSAGSIWNVCNTGGIPRVNTYYHWICVCGLDTVGWIHSNSCYIVVFSLP